MWSPHVNIYNRDLYFQTYSFFTTICILVSIILFQLDRWRNWGKQRLSTFPNAVKLMGGKGNDSNPCSLTIGCTYYPVITNDHTWSSQQSYNRHIFTVSSHSTPLTILQSCPLLQAHPAELLMTLFFDTRLSYSFLIRHRCLKLSSHS